MSIISNIQIPSKIISTNGELVSFFLIITISISFLLQNSKYRNAYVLNTLDILSNPTLLIYILILIFNVIKIIGPTQ